MSDFVPDWNTPFWSRVHPEALSGCWLWHGHINPDGYGRIGRSGAHRRAYGIVYGAIPDGMCVCHRCDVRACVNPAHLFLGTHAENMADMLAKGRAPSRVGGRNGRAKLTEPQTRDARRLRLGGESCTRIAARFGVDRSTIKRVISGASWYRPEWCEVEGCRNELGGPRDMPTMCSECSQQIYEQERESAGGIR